MRLGTGEISLEEFLPGEAVYVLKGDFYGVSLVTLLSRGLLL